MSAEQKEEAAAAREAHRVERERAERRGSLAKKSRLVGYSLGGVVAVGLTLFFLFRPGPEVAGVERPPNDGRTHVTGATFADAAPTSGPHAAGAPACGVYPSPLEPELAVHALEHGVVVLWYQADQPTLSADLVSATSQWDSHVIISPSATIASPIVATSWNRRMSFDTAGAGVEEFVDTYRERGPERVSCPL